MNKKTIKKGRTMDKMPKWIKWFLKVILFCIKCVFWFLFGSCLFVWLGTYVEAMLYYGGALSALAQKIFVTLLILLGGFFTSICFKLKYLYYLYAISIIFFFCFILGMEEVSKWEVS